MSVRDNWTAREELTFYFAETINDDAWRTNVTTVSQLGAPGLEGDVWRVELEERPHGVSQAALKVFKANFDMQAECIDPINRAKETGTPLHELIEPIARSFVSEATASIDNEHFLQPYAFGRMANRNAILMPVVDGDNLSDYIRNSDPSVETRLKLAAELCRAIDAMHQTGQLHNDIKPDNVMVDTSGPEPVIRIIDMGFLCQINEVKSIYGGPPRRVGTDGYMAPEIRSRGAVLASTASDSWSVGCTLFYILTSLELVTGVLDKKSQDAQTELYERLMEDMDQPLISVVRMARVPGLEDKEIGEALAVLLTTHPKHRSWKKRPLISMAEVLERRRGGGAAPPIVDAPGEPPTEPKVEPAPPRRAPVRVPVPTTSSEKAEEDFVKVIVRPVDGMKQIIVLMKDSEGYLRHQHVPQVDTSVSKLLRFTYIGGEVYVLPRDGLPGLKFDGKDWSASAEDANKKIPKEGVRIEIDGVQIDLELR